MMGRSGEPAWAASGKEREREGESKEFLFFLFHFFFKTNFDYKSNQVQILFPIYFSIQIKMRNFGKFFKTKFYNFLNSFIFKFSFTSKPFSNSFPKEI